LERMAVISDIHGNRWALEAVLDEIDRAHITEVVNLGDVFYGPLDPLGTAKILFGREFPTVRGNEDRIITDSRTPISDTLDFVRHQLQPAHMEWLRSLKPTMVFGPAFLFHGSPDSDTSYLLWDVDRTGVHLRNSKEVASVVGEIASSLILCGHDHVPRTMLLPGGRTVVNPGSVGLPAYWDNLPHPHVMETGAPHARYSIISRSEFGWSINDRAVPYDWESAANAANRNGRPDWAEWLRSGRTEKMQSG